MCRSLFFAGRRTETVQILAFSNRNGYNRPRKEEYMMPQATFSVRMDEGLKKQFDALCTDFGMSASTAINVFARAVVRERRIPFEIVSPEPESARDKAMAAFRSLRAQAQENFPQGMSLEEINEEIRKARQGEGE